jgi:predicted lipoprotein with Yx(FWY)xxD motif
MRRLLPTLIALALLPIAGCGGADDTSTQAETTSEPAGTTDKGKPAQAKPAGEPKQPGVTVSTHASDYGTIVTNGDGRALYLFEKETSDRAQCYGACATAWPPLLTKGEPRAAGGAQAAQLGTTERSDAKTQVTYRGHPLYYYESDTAPGEVGCQNVNEFGGLWLVVDPSGNAIQ